MVLRYLTDVPPLHRALTLWAILAVAVCVKTALLGGEHSVYPIFVGGSQHWWADMSLYDNYEKTEGLDRYRYSPTFAVAFTPFMLLPDRIGAIAWSLMSIAMLVWSLHVLVCDVLSGAPCAAARSQAANSSEPGSALPASKQWRTSEGVFLMLTLVGSAVGVWSGQSNAILLAMIVLGLAAMLRQRWWTASLLLALSVFIKLWPIAIVLLLMSCWPRQLTGRFAAICAVLALIPFLTRPPDVAAWQYREWYASVTGTLQARWPGCRDAWTIWEQLSRLVPGRADQALHRHVYTAMQLLTALPVLGWTLWQQRRAATAQQGVGQNHAKHRAPSEGWSDGRRPKVSRGKLDLSPFPPPTGHLLMLILSIWVSWQLLFGLGTEQLTYGIIAPSASWAVLVSFAEKRARWLTVTAWAMLALLASGDVEKAVLAVFPGGMILLPLAVALFVAWLVWHERGAVNSSTA